MDERGQDRAQMTRRQALRKAAFVAPAVLTLAAMPAFASAGSESLPVDPGPD